MEEDLKRTVSAKQVLRKSGKRVDNVMNSSTEFVSAPVTKDGILCLLFAPNKWKPVYFILCGSILYWKKKETATAILGEISLKDAKIEKVPKTNFVIKITKDDKSWQISTEKEIVCDEWINELIQNTQKPPSSAPLTPTGRKETRMLRAQKKVGGSIATSTAGKKIIREALGTEGYKSISIVKKVVSAVDGKKKAKEVEESIIRLGVKIILLAKSKEITISDLTRHKMSIKSVCDLMTNYTQFTFEYTHVTLQNQIKLLVDDISKTLSRYFSPKNMTRFTELQTYLSSAPILDMLFTDPNMRALKNEWHYLVKNVSSQLDLTE